MITKENNLKYHYLLDTFLNEDEKDEFDRIVYPFFSHEEFQKRMTKDFLHHSDITLGEHIIEDALVTYRLCKMKNVDTIIAVKIAMMHDLYEVPWQNNDDAIVKHFSNKHGFRHPIEAVINALTWYPEMFNETDSEILIDGIIHHMYPFPVRVFDDNDDLELKNYDRVKNLDKKYLDMIKKSSNRNKVGYFSFSRSKYKEGRVMSKADKKVSFGQIKNYSSAKALLTGKNKSIK